MPLKSELLLAPLAGEEGLTHVPGAPARRTLILCGWPIDKKTNLPWCSMLTFMFCFFV